jgi:MFS transporter, ACS family, L-galactonate transporter
MFDRAFPIRKLTARSRMLLLLAAIALLAGVGRDGIIAVTPGIRDFLHLPNDELEIAYRAFGFGFYPALVLGGALVELSGTSLALLMAGVGTAAAICLAGLAWSLTVLTISRLFLGLSAGLMVTATVAALAPWTPPRERGGAIGLVLAAFAAGAVVWQFFDLLQFVGPWRSGFLLVAALAASWVWACRRWFLPHPVETGDSLVPLPVYWRGALPILILPTFLALLQGWGMALCREWVPRYLLATWHFDIKLSGWVSATSGAAMILGCVAGGIAADRSLVHSSNIRSAHQIVPGVGFMLAAFSLILLPIGADQLAIALWLGLALFGLQAAGTMLWVFAIDIGGRHTGISAGFVGLGLLLSQLISPLYLFGLSRSVPAILGVMMLVLAGVLSFWLRPHIELPVRAPAPSVPGDPIDTAAAEIDALLTKPGGHGR